MEVTVEGRMKNEGRMINPLLVSFVFFKGRALTHLHQANATKL